MPTLLEPQINSPAVAGDMLSCFTASISLYMAAQGIDYQLALGTQLFLAARTGLPGGLPIGFAHYHRPLSGEQLTHTLALERRSAADPSVAFVAIRDECLRSGAVIVVGDAGRLSWMVSQGAKHVPHWFVIDAVDRDRVHVSDGFEFIDEQGTQEPFSGWLDRVVVECIVATAPDWPEQYRHRERWAFGVAEDLPDVAPGREFCQWFEAAQPVGVRTLTDDEQMALLRENLRWLSGAERPAAFDSSWLCGLEAVRMLPEYFANHLADPALYAISDDIWVVARTRALFARTLVRIGRETGREELVVLGDAMTDELVSQWLALPRVMRYNISCLERGRAPRALLVEVMREVAAREEQFAERLSAVV